MIYVSSNNVRHPVTKTFTTLHYTSPNYTELHFTTHAYITMSNVTQKFSYEIFRGLQINDILVSQIG
jgi:hypothetical protein